MGDTHDDSSSLSDERFDAVVVGAGFGGLGTALRLTELGARVCVVEAVNYPGGCAATFSRSGYRFEAGATLFSGFGEGQLFWRWIHEHGLDVTIDWLDPVVTYRAPGVEIDVPRVRGELVPLLARETGAPLEALERFFEVQRRVADFLWDVLEDPDRLPPMSLGGAMRHLWSLPRALPVARWAGRPLRDVLTEFGLDAYPKLVTFVDALSQITVQTSSAEAEAPLALSTLDYVFRGTGHVRGGIGSLANALVLAIREGGGDVRFATRAKSLRNEGDDWVVETSRGDVRGHQVVANLLPQTVTKLLRDEAPLPERTHELGEAVTEGWGACMLYMVVRPPDDQAGAPHHLQLVGDPDASLTEGNHVFLSASGPNDVERCPPDLRTVTVSTHLPLRYVLHQPEAERGRYIAGVQQRMRDTIAARAPEWLADVHHEMTASPRTFARFTGRHEGYVGGIPRRYGLGNYSGLSPRPARPGLWLVGDTNFPGQSTLATALGGVKTAEALMRGTRLGT